jgi:Family of unknown function (DUF5362)
MDNNQDNIMLDFSINDEAKSHFKDIAQWARINAIVSFVALGISLISTVMTLGRAGAASSFFGFLISAAISLLLNITLLQAADNIKKGTGIPDQGFFGLGLTKLASYFKILGILIIIVLVIAVIAFLFAIVIGLGRR